MGGVRPVGFIFKASPCVSIYFLNAFGLLITLDNDFSWLEMFDPILC